MRKLVLVIIGLLALFALFRAYSQDKEVTAGIRARPGLVEVGDGNASLGLAFGITEGTGDQRRLVSVLPLRVVYRDGEGSVSLRLSGLSFLLGGGASVGAPVVIGSLHRGDVLSVGRRVTVDSRVEGDVWVMGADAELSPHAVVTGDVVVIGGKLLASPAAVVGGTSSQLSSLKIPFVGVLESQFVDPAINLGAVAVGYALLGFALFMSAFYLATHARQMQQSLPARWKQALVTLGISVVVIPLITLLAVASVVGVFVLPALGLAVFLLALDGFLALCIRVGSLVRAPSGPGADRSLHMFTSGLLALFLISAPALAGVVLSAVRSASAARVGTVLQALSLALTGAGLAYGFGASLACARSQVVR